MARSVRDRDRDRDTMRQDRVDGTQLRAEVAERC